MKKIFTMLSAILITGSMFLSQQVYTQAPQKMSYQAVIRNSSNTLITSAPIGMRISILQGSSNGIAVYVETQRPTTNANGLASLGIGSGTVVSGNFSAINWASGPYFIKTEIDAAGGTNYTIIGTSELLSVPYALFSGNGSGSFWNLSGNNIFNSNTGNIGIGTNSPTTKLTLKTPINTSGWTHIGGADSIIVSEAIGGVSASIGTSTKHAFRINAGGEGRLQIYPTGDVVVGSNAVGSFGKFTVATPNNSYGISHLGDGGNILATRMGGTSAGIGTFSHTNMRIFANGVSSIFIAEATSNVGIGTDNPLNKLEVIGTIAGYSVNGYGIYGESTNGFAGFFNGKVAVKVLHITGGSDLAEPFETNGNKIEPGSVMIIDDENSGKLRLSQEAYDKKVAGIVSGAGGVNPGITLRQDGVLEGETLIAMSGKVYCKAEAFAGSIKPGDLLTTSDMAGYAMKASDKELSPGAVIGKAMTGLESGKGLILVLVNLQ